MDKPIRVLMITSEWPTPKDPFAVPFLVQQVDFLRRARAPLRVQRLRHPPPLCRRVLPARGLGDSLASALLSPRLRRRRVRSLTRPLPCTSAWHRQALDRQGSCTSTRFTWHGPCRPRMFGSGHDKPRSSLQSHSYSPAHVKKPAR